MKIGEVCNRLVTSVNTDESVQRAAELMREAHVGSLVVTQPQDDGQMPVGIVTDRDIVIEVIAKAIDPNSLTVGDIMSESPLLAQEDGDISDILAAMRKQRVRRVPVVNSAETLIGILALDDMLQLFATEMKSAAEIVGGQRFQESRTHG